MGYAIVTIIARTPSNYPYSRGRKRFKTKTPHHFHQIIDVNDPGSFDVPSRSSQYHWGLFIHFISACGLVGRSSAEGSTETIPILF